METILVSDLKKTVDGEWQRSEAKAVMEGLADVKAGRTVDGAEAIADIRSKYGI